MSEEEFQSLTSKKRYEDAYEKFMQWAQTNNINSFSETVLLTYFNELKLKYVATTLWSQFSMLKITLNLKQNVNIGEYHKVIELLKRSSDHYQPQKYKTLSPEHIKKFMLEAPDKKYLFTKVAMIIALGGACRRHELWKLKVDDFEDLNSAYLITLPDARTKSLRKFTLTGKFYELCKKYMSLRPENLPHKRFFLNYYNGKCTRQVVGINRLGILPMQIATFLKLPEAEKYTGHCFRKSSTTILDSGGLASNKCPEGYINDVITYDRKSADNILQSIENSSEATNTNHQTLTNDTSSSSSTSANTERSNPADIGREDLLYAESIDKMDELCFSLSMCWAKKLQRYDSHTRSKVIAKVASVFKEADDQLDLLTSQNSDVFDSSELIEIKTEMEDEEEFDY